MKHLSLDQQGQITIANLETFPTVTNILWNSWNNSILCCANYQIFSVDLDGNAALIAGSSEQGYKDGDLLTSRFEGLKGFCWDAEGNLWVLDGHRIRKISLQEGKVETVAGCTSSLCGGFRDGPALQAIFNTPKDIAFTRDATLLIADFGNLCIRQLKNGIVSTIAGVPKTFGSFDSPRSIVIDEDDQIFLLDAKLVYLDLSSKQVLNCYLPLPCESLQTDGNGNLNCLTYSTAQTTIISILYRCWRIQKFLWIGNLKEDASYCYLAHLPKEIVKEISAFVQGRPAPSLWFPLRRTK